MSCDCGDQGENKIFMATVLTTRTIVRYRTMKRMNLAVGSMKAGSLDWQLFHTHADNQGIQS